MSCRITRTSHWQARLLHESAYWEKSVFVTLTYDDEHLPEDRSLAKRELCLYFKRLRKAISPERIKYFACGEYGEQFARPHYHAIIFGVDRHDKVLKETWGRGFIRAGTVTADSIKYVCAYIQKKKGGDLGKEEYGDRLPPYQVQSKGIGLAWLNDNEANVISNLSITVKGEPIGLPRYYKKKLGNKVTLEEYENLKRIGEVKKDEQRANAGLKNWSKTEVMDLLEQKARQIEAKHGFYKKRDF